jgi:hypothetical protein
MLYLFMTESLLISFSVYEVMRSVLLIFRLLVSMTENYRHGFLSERTLHIKVSVNVQNN